MKTDNTKKNSQNSLSNKNPKHLTYIYDFATSQVDVVLKRKCILKKQVRLINDKWEKWCDSATGRVGDMVEFRVQYINCSGLAQRVSISEDLPPCLEYVKSEALLYGPDALESRPIGSNIIVTTGIEIENCEPEGSVIIYYTAKIIGHPPKDRQDRTWVWTEVQAGSKILQNYVEVVIG